MDPINLWLALLTGLVLILTVAVVILGGAVASLLKAHQENLSLHLRSVIRDEIEKLSETNSVVSNHTFEPSAPTKIEKAEIEIKPQVEASKSDILAKAALNAAVDSISTKQRVPTTANVKTNIQVSSARILKNEESEKGMQLLSSTNKSIFITGPAGTGKSTLLRNFIDQTSKQCVVLAPTGMAAINARGETIHGFFKFPVGPLNRKDGMNRRDSELYKAIDTIIIDEVSMVRADLMDAIDEFMRINGRDASKPFGGVQMVFIGDLYQLPPIVSGKEQNKYIYDRYKSPFFFDADVFDNLAVEIIDLRIVYRQSDPEFIDMLNAVRTGTISNSQLAMLNGRLDPYFVPGPEDDYITVTTTKASAGEINYQHISGLPGEESVYEARIDGDFNKEDDDTKLPADAILRLKLNAQVMFLTNDPEKRWVNGTMGHIKSLEDEIIYISVKDKGHESIYPVEREIWRKYRYRFNKESRHISKEAAGEFEQFPLALAWAVTIHKSQGQTFNKLIVDMGRGAFSDGQTYVGLSRCRSLNGMRLRKEISRADIKASPYVSRYKERLSRAEKAS